MRKYRTFLICENRVAEFVRGLPTPSDFRFSTEPDPSRRHTSNADGLHSSTQFGSAPAPDRLMPGHEYSSHLEIWAKSEEDASRLARLIYLGCMLAYPNPSEQPAPPWSMPAASLRRKYLDQGRFAEQFSYYRGVEVGCVAAVEGWGDLPLTYALEKHSVSIGLDCFTPHSASPVVGQVFPECYEDPAYHTAAAFAVVAAFSVVEELGLEVRASREKRRFLEREKRTWNPEVIQDLDKRLSALGLSAHDEFRWIVRGPATALREEMKLDHDPCSNPYERTDVEDRMVSLADALHLASWLRNMISAHRFSSLTAELGPYEVHNCQILARRLLSAALGLGRYAKQWGRDV